MLYRETCKMETITDIMKRNVTTVEEGTPIKEAIRTLVHHNFTGLPVVDTENQVIGIISEKDVLSLAIDINRHSHTPEQNCMLVEDFMTKDPVTIEATESLITLCSCLMKNKFRRVPVVLNNKLIGIITRKDVISYIFKLQA